MNRSFISLFRNLATIVLASTILTTPCRSATPRFNVVYTFQGTPDGENPISSMIFDGSGNLYGTTQYGGTAGDGTVFELTPAADGWTETVLYSFQGGSDGSQPGTGSLVMDEAGNLYGATAYGGSNGCAHQPGCGVAFELTPPAMQGGIWRESILYAFQGGVDGANPNGVILDKFGNLYGTTYSAGNLSCSTAPPGCGTVFELSFVGGSWVETTVHIFQGTPDGANPQAGLTMDASGNLYGATTLGGGGNGDGTVYELIPSNGGWSEKLLYSFAGLQANPASTLVFDRAGDLLGTAAYYCCGEVFALRPQPGGHWTEIVVTHFKKSNGFSMNYATPALDSHDNFYGTTQSSGFFEAGTVYELQRTEHEIVDTYYSFCPQRNTCPGGGIPIAGVTLDSAGNVYGTTELGGVVGGYGVVFEITP